MKARKHRCLHNLRGHGATRGFSLVEVSLAMGIIAFGLLAVFALLPVGLDTFHGAQKQTVVHQIEDRIAAEIKQTNFDDFLSMYSSFSKQGGWSGGMYRGWDIEGNIVARNDPRAVFLSSTRTNIGTGGYGGQGVDRYTVFQVPGGKGQVSNPDVRVVQTEVVYWPEGLSGGDPFNYNKPAHKLVKDRGDFFRSVLVVGNGVNTAPVQ